MIDCVYFKNFKSLRDIRCPLTRLTVIVGPNASGKTSLLQGMHYLSQLSTKRAPEEIIDLFSRSRGLDVLHSADGQEAMFLGCKTAKADFHFKASRTQVTADRTRLLNAGWFGGAWGSKLDNTSALQDPEAADAIRSLVFLQLDARELASPSHSMREVPRVEYSGRGLASVIANMALDEPDVFDELRVRMKKIVPQIKRIRVKKKKVKKYETEVIHFRGEAITTKVPREYAADTLVFDFENRADIPATNVSEGTMLALGLLTVLQSSARPKIILLDDIEKGLHPNAQRELVGMLREILLNQPDLQIIATSHSPYFLDFLDPSEVRLMAIGADGFSRCGMLTDHPEFEKWKDEMTPGEMWSFFGEKWLVEEKD